MERKEGNGEGMVRCGLVKKRKESKEKYDAVSESSSHD